MKLSRDFNEFLSCLAAEGMRYLLEGGYALAAHGLPRFTKDIGVWVACSVENADRILSALARFGFASLKLTREDLIANKRASGRLRDLADLEDLEKLG